MINKENIIPLAGMFQAAKMVYDIAHKGSTDQAAFEASIKSILVTDPETYFDVYGGIHGVDFGIDLLVNIFAKENKQRDMEIARYVLGIVHLEKKLKKNRAMYDKLGAEIDRIKTQSEIFGSATHENVIAGLAEVYAQTISTIQPQIMVSGEPHILTNNHHANKIRALLLALMRSTVLWLQMGGSRWHLILQRNKIIQTARALKANA